MRHKNICFLSFALLLNTSLSTFAQDSTEPAKDAPPAATRKPTPPPEAKPVLVPAKPAPDDHILARIKPGMKHAEALEILGKPTSVNAYCTGKRWIPYYFGRDRGRTDYYYKGQGVVSFHTDVTLIFYGCRPSTVTEVKEVHYDPDESGVAGGPREETGRGGAKDAKAPDPNEKK